MSTQDDGGPAFPHTGEGLGREFASPGMTLRDYFAAKAMAALIRDPWYADQQDKTAAELAVGIANDAYATADAMLKARHA